MTRAARLSAMSLCVLLVAAGCGGDGPEAAPVPDALACQAGAWRLDGALVSIVPVTGGLRYRLLDGRSGRLETEGKAPDDVLEAREGWREEGPVAARARFAPCAEGAMSFAFGDREWVAGTRVSLPQRDTRFSSGGTELRGRLVLPPGPARAWPLAVLVHGSERYSGVDSYPLQYLLPAQGVAVFVYDKRGTGGSEGSYTQDFHQLADDARAALAEARRLHPGGFGRAGFVGTSQGGWIAPLAASRGDADYAVSLYGLAENALAEDREQVMNDLRRKGHGEDVLAKAREVTDATAVLMASGFTRGFDGLQQVQARYGDEPWFDDIGGEFSGQVLQIPSWLPQGIARRIALREDVGTSWDYEPMPVLAALDAPQLWIIAAQDLEAPNVETLRRIRELQARQRPIDLAVFPRTDHGILEFEETGSDGERVMLRHADGYFRMVADWIREARLEGTYGEAIVERASDATTGAGRRVETGSDPGDAAAHRPLQ
jgi:alpha/beta superfamily hydrolase